MPRLLRLFWLATVLLASLTGVSTRCLPIGTDTSTPRTTPFSNVSAFKLTSAYSRTGLLTSAPPLFTAPAPIPFTYPASMSLVYRLFYAYTFRPHRDFLIACGVVYLTAAALFARALIKRHLDPITAVAFAGTVLVLSYPAVLQLFLANMEIAVWIIVALGIWACIADRDWTAATCFGLAASLKIFPFVYFGLLVSKKKYKEAVFGSLLAVAHHACLAAPSRS